MREKRRIGSPAHGFESETIEGHGQEEERYGEGEKAFQSPPIIAQAGNGEAYILWAQ